MSNVYHALKSDGAYLGAVWVSDLKKKLDGNGKNISADILVSAEEHPSISDGDVFEGVVVKIKEVISPRQVKKERQRRINEIADPDRQIFYLRKASALQDKGKSKLTAEEKSLLDRIRAGNEAIDLIVDKAVEIEAMDPIPADFTDDKYWK